MHLLYSVGFHLYLKPHAKQLSLCTLKPLPHILHLQTSSSLFRKVIRPCFLMYVRFSIMLIPYLVRYLLSRFSNLLHGYFSQSKQNPDSVSDKKLQLTIKQLLHTSGLFGSSFLKQPPHGLLYRR